MNITDYITGGTSLLALISGCIALYVAWRKSKPEVENLQADAAGKWLALAAKAGEEMARERKEHKEEIEELNKRVDALEKQTGEQDERIHCLETENADLRDWADRLVHQLKAREIVPVEMRKSTAKAKA